MIIGSLSCQNWTQEHSKNTINKVPDGIEQTKQIIKPGMLYLFFNPLELISQAPMPCFYKAHPTNKTKKKNLMSC